MAHYDSETRLAVFSPATGAPLAIKGEAYADEGTLILEPIAPSYPPPPSSMRPPAESWTDRAWSVPVSDRTGASALGERPRPAPRSSPAMLMVGAAAVMAGLVSLGLMRADEPRAESAPVAAAAAQPMMVAPVAQPVIAAPVAQPVVAPAPATPAPAPAAIEVDDEVAPAPVIAARVAPKAAPVAKAPPAPRPVAAAPAPAPAKKKAAQSAEDKTLEQLLEQLGEEQLKR